MDISRNQDKNATSLNFSNPLNTWCNCWEKSLVSSHFLAEDSIKQDTSEQFNLPLENRRLSYKIILNISYKLISYAASVLMHNYLYESTENH